MSDLDQSIKVGAAATATDLQDAKASYPAASSTALRLPAQSSYFEPQDQSLVTSIVEQLRSAERSCRKLNGRNTGLLVQALKSRALGRIRWDEFNWVAVREYEGRLVVLDDAEITRLLCDLQAAGFDRISERNLKSAVQLAARDDRCDAGQEWLRSRSRWDRIKRIRTFLHVYLGTTSDSYHEAVSEYIWTALATRIDQPGTKADMVPVLVGEQGVGKSTALGIIAGTPSHLGEVDLTDRPNRLFRKCKGKTVVVWEEMRGIRGKCDADEVKTRITSPTIEIDDKSGFGMHEYLRRFVIFGTSNRTDFLRDVTGHRRYLPFTVERVASCELLADIDQLWAEARHLCGQRRNAGLCPIAFEDAERLAPSVHQYYQRATRWGDCESLKSWLVSGPAYFKLNEALEVVGITRFNSESYWHDERDMAASLRQLGCVQARPTVAGRSIKMWRAPKIAGTAKGSDIKPCLGKLRKTI